MSYYVLFNIPFLFFSGEIVLRQFCAVLAIKIFMVKILVAKIQLYELPAVVNEREISY